jgi:hypothetical protein
MWRWLFLATGWLWYWWRVHTLTVNWATFPNKEEARAIWQKRSTFSLCLGAAVLNNTLYTMGLITRWWVLVVGFAVCYVVIAFAQPLFIVANLFLTTRLSLWKLSKGKDPQNSFLRELAIWPYLGAEEKEAYIVFQGDAFEEFHGDESLAVLLTDIVDGADVGMVERRGGLGFALKTGEGLRVAGNIFGQKFESDEPV